MWWSYQSLEKSQCLYVTAGFSATVIIYHQIVRRHVSENCGFLMKLLSSFSAVTPNAGILPNQTTNKFFFSLSSSLLSYSFKHSSIHSSVVSLITGHLPLPKRVLHKVQSSASFLNSKHPLFTLRFPSSCLHLLAPLPFPYIFCSILFYFQRKM